jgi:hypothetical protein
MRSLNKNPKALRSASSAGIKPAESKAMQPWHVATMRSSRLSPPQLPSAFWLAISQDKPGNTQSEIMLLLAFAAGAE